MSRVFLVRHAAVDTQGRYWGATDLPLSRVGRAQLLSLAHTFADTRVDVVYSSDLLRARETAAAISKDVEVDGRLREIDFGHCEGLTFDEIAARWPAVGDSLVSDPTSFVAPGGESFVEFSARVNEFVEDRFTSADGDVAVVAHRGSIALIAAAVLGRPPSETFKWSLAPAVVRVLELG
ncbi:MAG: Phosphoglycerate mutase [Solirubrobacterales bacterium]|nr:Phosphoglycerate mutase [Solirubrobacterales bacterium]